MAIFTYTALDAEGNERQGTIDALNMDIAIAALQRRGLVISGIDPAEKPTLLSARLSFFAEYLDRNFELTQKARNALVYPAFIMTTFVVVMTLMMTLVIPQLAGMLEEVGQSLPVYTKIVIGLSQFMTRYIFLILILLAAGGIFLFRFSRTAHGREILSRARLEMPAIGGIYRKIFLSRIADNLSTMLRSGIQVLRGLEITGLVVGDAVYEKVLAESATDVKGGMPLSHALPKHPEIPP